MKISFYTFGCTVNNYETQKMRDLFTENGDEIVEGEQADVFVINSCAITGAAEKGALQLIARLKKKNPKTLAVLVGCYGESLKKAGKTSLPGIDVILDNDKFDIVNKVYQRIGERKAQINASPASARARENGTPRVLVQVQNGCDNGCSFCIVPHVRGRSASTPFTQFKQELSNLLEQGYKEVVLAGLNLGFYRDGEYTLLDILQTANADDRLESIRLSSLEPMNVGDGFIEALPGITKLSPHLHISLQSGCDRTLARMNRKYSFEAYLNMIRKIRDRVPGIAITTDIIVGFPGESDADFQESINNIIRCQFSDIHIFKYSQRPNTAAAAMKDQVTEHQKIKRSILLKGVKLQSRYEFMSRFVGKEEKAILLKPINGGYEAVTAHGIKALVKSPPVTNDAIFSVWITGISEDQEALYATINA